MTGKVLDVDSLIEGGKDALAVAVSNMFFQYDTYRSNWMNDKRELRNYIFATDTKSTTNNKLPWKNSTTTPKLCQIRDNLHANYMAALFPHRNWLRWEGSDKKAETKKKRLAVQSYMENKTALGGFRETVSQLVYDFIDYGNAFATVEWVSEAKKDDISGELVPGFIGPRIVRINPSEIIFNPLSSRFVNSPKIIRSIKSLGDLHKEANGPFPTDEARELYKLALEKTESTRKSIASLTEGDRIKDEAYHFEGFGSSYEYMLSGYVEVLTFYGDIYDQETGNFLEDQEIVILDRSFVASQRKNPSWLGTASIRHVGWRLRPDNLYAMGPLDNLVGMQYRIDHLENAKADAFDLILHPVMKVRGLVEEFSYGPGAKIYMDDNAEVAFMAPDTTALNADMQIRLLEDKMEEMAGAPRQAMGIRTPGEKTAFEVQVLENAVGRIFQNKVSYFEQMLLEPILNDMLELARRNMDASDVVRVLGDDNDVVLFREVTREDLTSKGRLRPVGASHFARKANIVQNIMGLVNSRVASDPSVSVHISGKELARAMEELLELEDYNLVRDNVRIFEQAETQGLIQQVQSQTQLASMMDVSSGDPNEVARTIQDSAKLLS